ncbi:MAG: hypothetical protein J6X91_00445 [Bacteroidales bacterium]|nr:hypothetical protein [Bacteroidales bacterium]
MAIKRRMTIMTKKQPKYTTMPTDSPEDFQSLEDYKKAVKAYLTKKLGVSEQVSESWMKKSDKALEGYWEDKLPVSATATGIARGLL